MKIRLSPPIRRSVALSLTLLGLLLCADPLRAQGMQGGSCPGPTCFEVPASTLDAGGGLSCDAIGCIAPNFSVEGTIGQIDAHPAMQNIGSPANAFEVLGGFWYAQQALQVPVSMAEVQSRRSGERLDIDFATASNVGTVAFEILGANRQRLSTQPQLASAGDSLRPQRNRAEVKLADDRFWIRAIDLDGSSVDHGPYAVDQHFGRDPVLDQRAIDWAPLASRARNLLQTLDARALRATGSAPRVGLAVRQTGLQQVGFEDLAAAGADAFVGIPINELALLERIPGAASKPLQIVVRSADALFGPGDELHFLGRAADSLYTTESLYELRRDPALARRMGEIGSVAASGLTTHLQQSRSTAPNNGYQFSSPLADPFYARRIVATSAAVTQSISVPADGLQGLSGPVQLQVMLYGGTDFPGSIPDHHVQLRWNGSPIADRRFDGLSVLTLELQLLATQLQADNTLELVLPADAGFAADVVLLESVSLRYQRRLLATAGRLDFVSETAAAGCSDALFAHGFEGSGGKLVGECRGFSTVGLAANALIVREAVSGALDLIGGASGDSPAFAVNHQAGTHFWLANPEALHSPSITPLADTSTLLDGSEADYLIISHPLFLDSLQPLVVAKQAQGLSVKLIDVRAIYESYSAGRVDPMAIRDYLRAAHEALGTRYVLLVGASNFDPLNHLGSGAIDFLPTPYRAFSSLLRFGPADPALADLDDDGRPDLAIGRLPARSAEELALMLDKSLRYASEAGAYAQRALLVNDRQPDRLFGRAGDNFVAALGPSWITTRIDRDQQSIGEARVALLAGVQAGSSLVQYFGHSSPTRWAFDNLLNANEISAGLLANPLKPTVVLQWGCWNSYFVDPTYDSIGVSWINQPSGAAAVVGATVLTEAGHDAALAAALLSQLAVPGETLGEALLRAKQSVSAEQIDSQYGISLLGDPALEMH